MTYTETIIALAYGLQTAHQATDNLASTSHNDKLRRHIASAQKLVQPLLQEALTFLESEEKDQRKKVDEAEAFSRSKEAHIEGRR